MRISFSHNFLYSEKIMYEFEIRRNARKQLNGFLHVAERLRFFKTPGCFLERELILTKSLTINMDGDSTKRDSHIGTGRGGMKPCVPIRDDVAFENAPRQWISRALTASIK